MENAPAIGPAAARFCQSCGGALADHPTGIACRRRSPRTENTGAKPEAAAIRRALALYFSLLAAICLAEIVEKIAGPLIPSSAIRFEAVVSALLSCLVIAFAVAGWRILRPALTTPGPRLWCLLAPLAALGTFTVSSLMVTAVNRLLHLDPVNFSNPFASAGFPVWYAVLLVCLQPAVFEEIAFRGLINSSLGRILSTRQAIIVGALLFATLHLSPLSFPHLLVMGLALGYIRHRSGSLLPCIILHFCHNGLSVLAEHFPGSFP